MAYGEKYRGYTKSFGGGDYQVRIYQDGWTGATTDITIAQDGIIYSMPEVEDIFNPIRGTTVTVTAESNVNYFFEEFFTTEFGEYKLELYDVNSASIIWEGFNVIEVYQESFEAPPYFSTLKFIDGLAELKNIEFPNTGNLQHLMQIIRLCLNQINDLNIFEVYDLFEDNMTTGANQSMWVQAYTNTDSYVNIRDNDEGTMSCYEVLGHVLRSFGCTICQMDGAWWIVRVINQANPAFIYREFLPAVGSESSTTVNSNGTLNIAKNVVNSTSYVFGSNYRQLGNSGTFSLAEKNSRVCYEFEVMGKDSSGGVLFNPKLFYINNPKNGPSDYWTATGMTAGSANNPQPTDDYYAFFNNGQTFINLDAQTSGTSYQNKYFEQVKNNLYVNSNDKLNYSITLGAENDSNRMTSVAARFKIVLFHIATSTYYTLYDDGTWSDGVNNDFSITLQARNTYGGLPSLYTYEIPDYLLTNIPVTGLCNLTVRYYKPQGPATKVHIKGFDVIYLQGNAPQKQIRCVELDNYKKTYKVEAFHGTSDFPPATKILRNSIGEPLTTFDGGTELREILVDDILRIKGRNNRIINTSIEGEISPFTKYQISMDYPSGTVTQDFIATAFSANLMRDSIAINLEQIEDAAYTAVNTIDVEEATTDDQQSSPPTARQAPNNINNGSQADSDGSGQDSFM